MKIAVSSTGNTPDSAVDPRFGRAKGFLIFDTASGEHSYHDNSLNLNAVQGAGIQSAKNVADMGAEAVITGNVGPKAFAVLEKAGIAVYTGATGSAADALKSFENGSLAKTGKATVEGHW